MSSIEQNKELVTRYMQLQADGKIEEAMSLVDDACVFWHPMAGNTSKEQMRQTLLQVLGLMASFRSKIRNLTAEGDRVSAEMQIEIDTTTGKKYRNDYHFLLEIRENKIVACREYVDTVPVREAFFS